jgi:predicted nucleic acid-binding protein
MSRRAARADFFDASALAKVYTREPGSDVAREYFNGRPTKYTTPFCFYEAMNVLKGKWKHKGQLSLDEYLDAAFRLTAWYGASSSRVKDLNFTEPTTFAEARTIAQRSQLDLSDAFQILSVKKGYFSVLVNDSATVLVTADGDLAKAARTEGLRVWNLMTEPAPQ